MTRDEIKHIVYDSAYNTVSDEYIKDKCMVAPKDGEDLLLYQELEFDSLDMVEFLIYLEYQLNNHIHNKKDKLHIADEMIDSNITFGKIIDYIYKNYSIILQ